MKDNRSRLCTRCVWVVLSAIFVFSPVFLGLSAGQVTFERVYGGSRTDIAYSVRQTPDGGYIVAGETRSFGAGGVDVWLVKTDSLGDTVWTKTYGDPTRNRAYCLQSTVDGGFVIVGLTGGLGEDVYIIKIDSLGDTLWTQSYGEPGDDRGYCIQQTLDGGYIIAGHAHFMGPGTGDIWLLKTDSFGDTIWTRTYGDTLLEIASSVQQTIDGGYIVSGLTLAEPDFGLWLLKTDSLGDTVWTRVYGGYADRGYSVQQTTDGGYIIAGQHFNGPGGGELWLLKTDSLGDTLWTRIYGGPRGEFASSLQQTPDGGYILAGNTSSFGAGGPDVYLIKTDSLGDTLWTRTYGGTRQDMGWSIQQTSDGGYVIAGHADSFGEGFSDFYLIKTDENGLVIAEKDGAVLSIDAPGDTVFSDSSYGVIATVQNLGNVVLTFDVVVTIDGYVDTFHVSGLGPGYTREATFRDWLVPPGDSATYTMTVCTRVLDDVDSTNDCGEKTIFAYNPLGVEESSMLGARGLRFELLQNEPNPFGRQTLIAYSLPVAGAVALEVYDITGRLVESLVDEHKNPGVYEVHWEAKNQAGGIYFYRLQAGGFTATKKMTLLK